MLQRPVKRRSGGRNASALGKRASRFTALSGLALIHCSAVGGDESATRASSQPIIGGTLADAPDSPVLLLQGPEGGCSAVLVAPTLVLTARHCVANTTPGAFQCTAAGEVVNTGSGAGQIGTDNAPGSLSFFQAAKANADDLGSPDAVGTQVISTQTPTACRDDLAFVVLDRAIPGLVPASIRITRPTSVGEVVSVWGYGLTDQSQPTELRTAGGVPIAGVGPDVAPDSPQLAPVRAVRVGPVTCQGDSGGPIISTVTGAVIAIVSLGSQAGTNGPFCTSTELTDTTGPRLGAYADWIDGVFQGVGASPITDDPAADASTDEDVGVALDARDDDGAAVAEEAFDADAGDEAARAGDVATDSSAAAEGAPSYGADSSLDGPAKAQLAWGTGSSCATGVGARGGPKGLAALWIALAWTAIAVGRRRR